MAAGGGRPGSAAPGAGAWRSGSAQPCCSSPGGGTRRFCRPFPLSSALVYLFISILFLSNCVCSWNTFALQCFSRILATKSAVSERYRRARATPMAPAGRAARNAAAPAGRAVAPHGAPPPSASSARRGLEPACPLPSGFRTALPPRAQRRLCSRHPAAQSDKGKIFRLRTQVLATLFHSRIDTAHKLDKSGDRNRSHTLWAGAESRPCLSYYLRCLSPDCKRFLNIFVEPLWSFSQCFTNIQNRMGL